MEWVGVARNGELSPRWVEGKFLVWMEKMLFRKKNNKLEVFYSLVSNTI